MRRTTVSPLISAFIGGLIGASLVQKYSPKHPVIIEDSQGSPSYGVTIANGQPAERRLGGWFWDRRYQARLPHGEQNLIISALDSHRRKKVVEEYHLLDVELLKGLTYRVSTDQNSQPRLVVTNF